MFPVLLKIGGFSLHTYGFLIAVGFFFACWLATREAEPYREMPREFILDSAMWAILWGLLGSRVLYVITRWDDFAGAPLEMIKIWNGGVVFYGGLIGGASYIVWAARKQKVPLLLLLDVFMPTVALAHAFGRMGCFMAGCCYGLPTDKPWGVTFTNPDGIARPLGTPLHPTQLYEAAANLAICGLVLLVRMRFKKTETERRSRYGLVAGVYLMLYAISRSFLEEYRGDRIRGFLFDGLLSTSQFVSIFIFLAGAGMVFRVWKGSRSAPNA